MKTRGECGAAYLNSVRKISIGKIFCDTDWKENGMMFINDDAETNESEVENDKMKPVNSKQDDKIDVAMESIAGENNVMVDRDEEKSAEDDAADDKYVKSGDVPDECREAGDNRR